MKNLAKKICSLALALALALCCLPAAFAAENKITVDFSFYNGAVVMPKTEIAVTDGIAETYGYTLSSNSGVTVFDAIVAAHKAYYGDAFTTETADNYLSMSYGFMTKMFGISTSSIGFCVNDKVPHDGVYNEAYMGYTGCACDAAVIKNGDYVSTYTYKDPSWLDYYITLSENEIDATAGKEFTLSATGYSIMWYGCALEETIKNATSPMEGLEVYLTTDFKNYSKIGTLDKKGEIKLTINEIGKVYLCISGKYNGVPAVANWCEVTVSEPEGAIYLPKSIDIEVDTESKDGIAVIICETDYFDIAGKCPDKTEICNFEITLAPLVWLFKLIASIL